MPNNVKYKRKQKFPPKILEWISIIPKGHSKPYFVSSKGEIDKKNYSEECIEKRLLPFIKKYHKNEEIMFWPDLAWAHYANMTKDAFSRLEISCVSEEENPPNCPQIRPIEDFWAEHKRQVYEGGWEAKTTEELKKRILLKLNKY